MFLQHFCKCKLVLWRDWYTCGLIPCRRSYISLGVRIWHKPAPPVQISSKIFESVPLLLQALIILDLAYWQFPNSTPRLVIVHPPATGLKLTWTVYCVCLLIDRNGKCSCLMQVRFALAGDLTAIRWSSINEPSIPPEKTVQISKFIQYMQLSRYFED